MTLNETTQMSTGGLMPKILQKLLLRAEVVAFIPENSRVHSGIQEYSAANAIEVVSLNLGEPSQLDRLLRYTPEELLAHPFVVMTYPASDYEASPELKQFLHSLWNVLVAKKYEKSLILY